MPNAQIPSGPTPPAMTPPPMNQPVTNNQPMMAQAQPVSQPSYNPAIMPAAPSNNPSPAGMSQSYGQSPRPIPSPMVAEQSPPMNSAPNFAQAQPQAQAQMQPPAQYPPNYATQSPPPMNPAPAYGTQAPPMVVQQQQVAQQQQPVSNIQAQPSMASQAPAGNLAFGLDGCCPVSLVEKQQWVPGDQRWGANHRGRVYLFAGPEEQRRFFADPDRYAPAVSGNDVVLAAELGQAVPGMRAFGVYYRNRVFLFSSPESRAKFEQNPNAYSAQTLEAFRSGAYRPGQQWR